MPTRPDQKTIVSAVYVFTLFVQIVDGTIINIALPTLSDVFDASSTAVSWTVLSFALALSVAIPVAGWLGDRFGLKRVFLAALAGFTVASMACGLAGSLGALIAFRAVQGLFSGVLTPIGAALLFKAFPLHERSDAARKVITVVVLAPALGPVIGGVLLEYTSWRWIFFVNLPIGVVALAVAAVGLVEDRHPEPGRLDVAGFALSVLGLGLLIFGISQGPDLGWASPEVSGSIIAGLGLIATLVVIELRTAEPLLALRLFEERLFRSINIVALPLYAAFISLILLIPLFLDEAGHDPLRIGLTMLPQPLGVMATTQIVGRYLYRPVGPRRLIMAGSAAALVCSLGVASLGFATDPLAVSALLFGRGLAMGVVFVPIQTAVYGGIEPPDMARATALFSTVRQFSPALGIAIVTAVLAVGLQGTTVDEISSVPIREQAYQSAMLASAAMYAVAFALAAALIVDSDAAATRAPATSP